MAEWDSTPEARRAHNLEISKRFQPGNSDQITRNKRTTAGQALRRSRSSGFSSRFRPFAGGAPNKFLVETNVGRRGITGRAKGPLPSRMPGFHVDPRSILLWEQYAADFKENAEMFRFAVDKIAMIYALVALAGAQKRSLGPVDPGMTRVAAAWKVPVRRISGDYFMGWTVEHMTLGIWALTNHSREAFYIEFGINHAATTGAVGPGGMRVRIRRPIMKLACLEAINIVRATGAAQREVISAVMPSSLYQSPFITGAIRPAGKTGSAIGLVDIEALRSLTTASGGSV